ncbi:uncharacterized protein PGTG_19959 [Puccinia graminis f. sp. tritici CRL 75-36-700-3]|uniref:Uncharacterized protein n=1 Tax=Puccinia graminis f. sp. tritici (strain CRL 75-36-700-3 / race SCCL) TaxID=418459 RepID=E3LBT7_PUCGT|nr:uncharacterized protein PGTG_19959 [Puccinia graminis f. sp. tritici CRL 75-36-700-3]EFP94012.1 hypothetical protein PGTG_19959 [Puccinia graminis f. sp. tritici CRL 75-36-700-3]
MRCLKAALINQTTQPAGAANDIDPPNLPLPSSNPASRPPSPRPSPPLISSQSDCSSVLPPPPLPQHKAASRSAASLIDLQLGSSIVPPSSPLPQPNTTSRPNTDPKANTTPRRLHTSKPFPSSDQLVSDKIVCDQATARLSLSPPILLKSPPVRSRSLDSFPSSNRPASGKVKRNQTKLETKPSTGGPESLCSTTVSSPPSKNPNSNTDDGLALLLYKDNLTFASISLTHHLSSEPKKNSESKPFSVINPQFPLNTNLTTPTCTETTSNCLADESKHSEQIYSALPPFCTSTPPLVPIQESLAQVISSPISPIAPACPANLEIAAIGSLTVENDDSNTTDAQLAPEYSQATLDYYNDIQEYLQQANTDETETKKKKKKKKKKKANPTSTPDNPILFYV